MFSEKIKKVAKEIISAYLKEIIKVKYEDKGTWVTTPEKIKEMLDSKLELIVVYKEYKEAVDLLTNLQGEKMKLPNGETVDIE